MDQSIPVLDSPELRQQYAFVDLSSPVAAEEQEQHGKPVAECVAMDETPPSAKGGRSPRSTPRAELRDCQGIGGEELQPRILMSIFQSCMDGPGPMFSSGYSSSSAQVLCFSGSRLDNVAFFRVFSHWLLSSFFAFLLLLSFLHSVSLSLSLSLSLCL